MTSPVNFGNFSPPQVVPARDEGWGDLARILVSVAQGRQQIAARRDELALQRDKFKHDVEMDKPEKERRLKELERASNATEAADIVAQRLPGLLLAPGDRAENLTKLRVELIQGNRKLAPFISAALDAQVKGLEDAATGIAQRRTAESTARVTTETEPERIAKPKVDLAASRVVLETARIEQGLEQLRKDRDPQRIQTALAAWEFVPTWAGARKVAGLAPGGIPDNAVRPKDAGAGGARMQDLAAIGQLATLGNAMIEAVPDAPVLLSKLRMSAGQGPLGTLMSEGAAALTSPAQRQLVQGYLMLGTAFGKYITGQQSSEREAQRLINITAEPSSADPATREQYRLVRRGIVSIINQASQGQLTPSAAAALIAEQANTLQLSPAIRRQLEQMKAEAARYERTGQPIGKTDSGRIPLTPADALISGRVRVAP